MLPIIPVSVYCVFPLFFLYLRVLPDYRGDDLAVVGATCVAILNFRAHLTYGAVTGANRIGPGSHWYPPGIPSPVEGGQGAGRTH